MALWRIYKMAKQTYCQQLKAFAEKEGVEFKKSWNEQRITEEILKAGHELPEPIQDEAAPVVDGEIVEGEDLPDDIDGLMDDIEDEIKNETAPIPPAEPENTIDPFAEEEPEQVDDEEDIVVTQYEETALVKETRKNLVALRKEFSQAKDDLSKKRVAQKAAIIRKNINDKKDSGALILLLQWLRARKMISSRDMYVLNQLEMYTCVDLCEHHQKISASGHHLELGRAYRYKSHFDEDRGEEMYQVYIPRVIEPEEQISKALERKMKQGFMPTKSDYANERILVSSSTFKESEFVKYFRILKD